MNRAQVTAVTVGTVVMMAAVLAEDMTPSQVFAKAKATYESMQTYKAQGIITSEIDTGTVKGNTETSFSILLKKPNLYLISWTQKNMPTPGVAQSGTVWSDGTQPYLYMGMMKAYSKMGSDDVALGGATGISGGAAFTIPSLFLSVFKGQPAPFSRLIDPKMDRIEKVGEEDCYVIRGASAISSEEAFWISTSRNLIVKYSRSLKRPEGRVAMPEIPDAQLEQAIKDMGQPVTEESKQKMREMVGRSKTLLETTQLKGSATELHTGISSPEVNAEDFQFAVPEGTALKESLFGGALGEDKEVTKALRARSVPAAVLPSQGAEASKAPEERMMKIVQGDLGAATSEVERFYALGNAARNALKEGKTEEARKLADELARLAPKYPNDGNYGTAIQVANQVLGRIALAEGNVAEAKKRLLASADSKGSPVMNSFGPNMQLAKDLLAKGEREVVLEYFKRCRTFWEMGADRLAAWTAAVNKGEKPEFGANLEY